MPLDDVSLQLLQLLRLDGAGIYCSGACHYPVVQVVGLWSWMLGWRGSWLRLAWLAWQPFLAGFAGKLLLGRDFFNYLRTSLLL